MPKDFEPFKTVYPSWTDRHTDGRIDFSNPNNVLKRKKHLTRLTNTQQTWLEINKKGETYNVISEPQIKSQQIAAAHPSTHPGVYEGFLNYNRVRNQRQGRGTCTVIILLLLLAGFWHLHSSYKKS